MTDSKLRHGLTLSTFASVADWTTDNFKQKLLKRTADGRREMLLPSWWRGDEPARDRWNRYFYRDALFIEVARAFADDRGLSFAHACEIVTASGAIDGFETFRGESGPGDDFFCWEFVGRPRGSDAGRFLQFGSGTLPELIASTRKYDGRRNRGHLSHFFVVNVSEADRRLRNRAERLRIKMLGDEFVEGSEAT